MVSFLFFFFFLVKLFYFDSHPVHCRGSFSFLQSKNGKSWRNTERPKKRLHLHGVMDKINRFCREEGGVILQTRMGEHLSFLRAHSDTVHILVFAQAWSLLGLFYLRETLWPVTGALILLLEGVDYCFGGNRYLIFIFSQGREFCPTPHYQLCWYFAFGKETATLTVAFIVPFPTPCGFCCLFLFLFCFALPSPFQICWLLKCLSCFWVLSPKSCFFPSWPSPSQAL